MMGHWGWNKEHPPTELLDDLRVRAQAMVELGQKSENTPLGALLAAFAADTIEVCDRIEPHVHSTAQNREAQPVG